MIKKQLQSHDGITIRYAFSESNSKNPWITLIMPFGLHLEMASVFFNYFSNHYNIVTWQSRSILDDSSSKPTDGEFIIENHVADLRTILTACNIKKSFLIGYCSGAGIALAAANRLPQLFSHLILLHGEYVLLNKDNCSTEFAKEIDSLLSLAGADEKYLQSVFDKIKDQRIDSNTNRPDGIDAPFTRIEYLRRHAANYLSYKTNDFKQLAQAVSHRTFLISGKLDAQANTTSTEEIASVLPNAQVYIDPNADHYGILRDDSSTMVTIWNYLYDQRTALER